MKTSLLFVRHSDSFPRRAYLPRDSQEPPFHTAKFVEAHKFTSTPFSLEAGKGVVLHKERVVHRPDSVDIYSDSFSFKNGKTECVRIIPQEYIDKIDAIDNEIRRLSMEQHSLIEEAWRRGTPLRKSDLES